MCFSKPIGRNPPLQIVITWEEFYQSMRLIPSWEGSKMEVWHQTLSISLYHPLSHKPNTQTVQFHKKAVKRYCCVTYYENLTPMRPIPSWVGSWMKVLKIIWHQTLSISLDHPLTILILILSRERLGKDTAMCEILGVAGNLPPDHLTSTPRILSLSPS